MEVCIPASSGEIQICHRADEQNVLKIVHFPQ
jgi:hypothetical protein